MAEIRTNSIIRILIPVVVILGLAFLGWQFIASPYLQMDREINQLKGQEDTKRGELVAKLKDLRKLNRYRLLSLSPDLWQSRQDYHAFLREILERSDFKIDVMSSVTEQKVMPDRDRFTVAKKDEKPVYHEFNISVKGRATISNLAKALKRFEEAPVLHRIEEIILTPVKGSKGGGRPDELAVDLKVEALVVDGAQYRSRRITGPDERLAIVDGMAGLRGGVVGLAMVPWTVSEIGVLGSRLARKDAPDREYAMVMPTRNIFVGGLPPAPEPKKNESPPLEVLPHVVFTKTGGSGDQTEATLYNRATNRTTRLAARRGFNSFTVYNTEFEPVLEGKVLRVEPRDLYFEVDDVVYRIHIGQSLQEASRQVVNRRELEELGLTGKKTEPKEQKVSKINGN